jgi:hypothetical protein
MNTEGTDDLGVRIPKARKREQLFGIIADDEDFRFGRVKVERDRQRFTVAAPTDDDEDATKSVKVFYGIIPYFRKCWFKDQNKEGEKVEKREVTVVRCDKYIPEQVYVSRSGFWLWKNFLAAVEKMDQHYAHVLVKFTAEPGQSQDGQFKFSKPKMEIVRSLTDDEIEYVDELREVVRARVRKYSSTDDLDAAEDKFLDDEDKPKQQAKPAEEEDEDAVAAKAAQRTRNLVNEDDGDEDTGKGGKGKDKDKSKTKATEEEEEETTGKGGKGKDKDKSKTKATEEEEEPAPKSKGKFPDLDSDGDEGDDPDLKSKGRTTASIEDED